MPILPKTEVINAPHCHINLTKDGSINAPRYGPTNGILPKTEVSMRLVMDNINRKNREQSGPRYARFSQRIEEKKEHSAHHCASHPRENRSTLRISVLLTLGRIGGSLRISVSLTLRRTVLILRRRCPSP